jgi:hypothetical protein
LNAPKLVPVLMWPPPLPPAAVVVVSEGEGEGGRAAFESRRESGGGRRFGDDISVREGDGGDVGGADTEDARLGDSLE